MDANLDRICHSLDKMSHLLDHLVESLQEDQEIFKNIKPDQLDANNHKKNNILNDLRAIITELNDQLPKINQQPLSLQEYVKSLEAKDAQKAHTFIEKICSILTNGYQQLSHNNQQVMTHLGFMNEFWCKLNGEKLEAISIYDKPKRK